MIALIKGIYELRGVGWFAPFVPLSVAVLLIYVPVLHSSFTKQRITYIDRNAADIIRALKWFLITALIILPLFLIGSHYWHQWVFGLTFRPRMVPNLGMVLLDQFLLVAIPEEIFFRGWLQQRMNRICASRWKVFGVQLGWGWILTCLLFAAAHSVILVQWWHFAIFFPALLFGWLREKTGTILAPSLWHCLGNMMVYWIGYSYVRL